MVLDAFFFISVDSFGVGNVAMLVWSVCTFFLYLAAEPNSMLQQLCGLPRTLPHTLIHTHTHKHIDQTHTLDQQIQLILISQGAELVVWPARCCFFYTHSHTLTDTHAYLLTNGVLIIFQVWKLVAFKLPIISGLAHRHTHIRQNIREPEGRSFVTPPPYRISPLHTLSALSATVITFTSCLQLLQVPIMRWRTKFFCCQFMQISYVFPQSFSCCPPTQSS